MDRNGRFGDRRHDNRGGVKPNYFLPKPVKVGDVVSVTVEAVASKGDGIAKKDGFVIFIKGAKQGQTVSVKITDVRARFAIGEVTGEGASEASAEEGADAASEEPSDETDSSSESEESEI
ncbi:MAG: TRAM domain-containing protein [Candidatus Micrarchaeia archaeon]